VCGSEHLSSNFLLDGCTLTTSIHFIGILSRKMTNEKRHLSSSHIDNLDGFRKEKKLAED
jgi:hypothetical protein